MGLTILRSLGHHRLALLAVALVAVAGGMLLAYRVSLMPPSITGRQHEVGLARMLVLVDTPKSQVVDLAIRPGGDIVSLSQRARLLASLLVTSRLRDEVAARAGVPPGALVVLPPKRYGAMARLPLEVPAGTIGRQDRRAHVLSADVPLLAEGQTPVIELKTQGPNPDAAGRLVTATVAVIQSHLAATAARERVPVDRRVVVRPLNGPDLDVESRGWSGLAGIVAMLSISVLGCAAIVALSTVAARGRRPAPSPTAPPRQAAAPIGRRERDATTAR